MPTLQQLLASPVLVPIYRVSQLFTLIAIPTPLTIHRADTAARSEGSSSGSIPSWQSAGDRFHPRDRRVRERSCCTGQMSVRTIPGRTKALSNRNAPNLQSSGTEHARAFVLGQVWGSRALVVGNLLLARLLHQFARISRVGIARDNDVLSVDGRLVGIIAFGAIVILETLLIEEVLRLVFLENLLMRLVVVASGQIQLACASISRRGRKLQQGHQSERIAPL